jgi:CelD/BcsL family acetyltransferase involved in cellulose biosynthesis
VVNIVVGDVPRDADEWDRLVDSAAIPTPFARSWWLQAWSGPGAQILHVIDGAELIGGLALESASRLGIEHVRLLGHALTPDHCDLLARPGTEATVAQAIADWFTRPGQRRIALSGVADRAALLRALPSTMTTSVIDIAPCHRLPDDFATYLSSRHRMFRKNICRYRRQMVDRGLRHHVIAPGEAEFGIAELRRLHSISFGAASNFLPHFDQFARAARIGIEKGEVLLHAALDGDRAVAIEVVFEVAGRVSTYQGGRDTADPRAAHLSNVLISHAIEHAIERDCRELDMLRGGQDYKRAWADDVRMLLFIGGSSGAVATGVQRSVNALKMIKRVVRRPTDVVQVPSATTEHESIDTR